MRLDTGRIFKRPVLCGSCNEDYLFTLRAIAQSSQLTCPACGHLICMDDAAHEPLVREVKNSLRDIDSASAAPAFDYCNPCINEGRERDAF
jgi:hypothetical protein